MSTEVAIQKSEYQDKINDFIGGDCEIVLNNSFGADVTIDDLSDKVIDSLTDIFLLLWENIQVPV